MLGEATRFDPERARLAGIKSGETRRRNSDKYRTARIINEAAEKIKEGLSDGVIQFWNAFFDIGQDKITCMMNLFTPSLMDAIKDRNPANINGILRTLGYDNTQHVGEIKAAMTEGNEDRSRIEVNFITDAELETPAALPAPTEEE